LFPSHHPDPTDPKNLEEIISLVKDKKLDIGLAFDGDGDRLGVVSSRGNIVWGDQILALLSKEVLKDMPKSPIIADVKASQNLFVASTTCPCTCLVVAPQLRASCARGCS
jgi:phosphomannomutase